MTKEELPQIITAEITEGNVRAERAIFTLVESPRKGGRPAYKLTKDGIKLVEYLASINCTRQEIYAAMNSRHGVLNNVHNKKDFTNAFNKGKEKFLLSIRDSQAKIMKKGNATMAIFLGKNYLGQSDRSEVDVTLKAPEEMTLEELYNKLKGDDTI